MFYKARTEAIKFYIDSSLMVSEAKAKATKGTGLKILTPKRILQRLLIALPQGKAGNNAESLLNEIRQLVYTLYQSKQITKKYTITESNPSNYKMDTIFMNSGNSKTSKPHV